ncbi:macro domain-containing protein [Streptosporangium sp. NBC_01495]|uniref:macro domain-containing protein n=1 Tax=Streptosporangium sp. NBC_01495 TaxID=2903899 RepID=UPI002E2F8EC8|nr:macro domain-containing protein [Streptosporangium sp. NBC_01495]
MISYVTGDATVPVGSSPKIIAHVCNDAGGWGRGFVVALSRRWPAPEAAYRAWYRQNDGFALGAVRLVQVDEGLWVANMIAQHGVRATKAGPPIRYQAVNRCLETLADHAVELDAGVHMPRIGCGLAGGTWDRIEPIITECLVKRDVEVTVYDLDDHR